MTTTDITMTRGSLPSTPTAVDVALEASTTNERATAMIAASWRMVESYTGRLYWPATAATAVAVLDAQGDAQWPRQPYPDSLTVEQWSGGAWAAVVAEYVPEFGAVLDLPAGRYRLTTGAVDPGTPAENVSEACRALALYQLIHSPARREFRSITAGDSTMTREALAGLFKASGAGLLLAGEVRW